MSNGQQIVIIIACASALFVVGAADKCGTDDPCAPTYPCELGEKLSNPSNCHSFQECVAPYEYAKSNSECGDNKGVFSNRSCSCSSNHKCRTWTCPPRENPPQEKESAPCFVEPMAQCGTNYITIPDQYYCTKYFVCNNNVWTSAMCPQEAPYYDVSISYLHPPCSNNIARCSSIPFEQCTQDPGTTTTTVATTTTGAATTTTTTTTPATTTTALPELEDPHIGNGVAFSVARSARFGPVQKDTEVPFDIVEVNLSDGFNEDSSHFVAPTPGVYVFMFSLQGSGFRAYLSLNGMNRAGVATSGKQDQDQTVSHSVVLELVKGDEVWIALAGSNNDISSCGRRSCTFSGYRVN